MEVDEDALVAPADCPRDLTTSRKVRCSGMISFFSLLSEVTREESADHEPWRIPPSLSNVTALLPLPTLAVYAVLAASMYREPMFRLPCTESPAPKRENPRSDKDDPSVKKSITDIEAPSRNVPLPASADPSLAKLLSDNEAPKLAKPNTDIEAPTRENLLRDSELPILAKSITARENREPNLAIPKTASADATRATPRRDRLEPKWKKSNTESEPTRAKPSMDNDEAKRITDLRDKDAPR